MPKITVSYKAIEPQFKQLLPNFTLDYNEFETRFHQIYYKRYLKALTLIEKNNINEIKSALKYPVKDTSFEADVMRRLALEQAFISNPSQWTPYLNLVLLNPDGSVKLVNAHLISNIKDIVIINEGLYYSNSNHNTSTANHEFLQEAVSDSQQIAMINAKHCSDQFNSYIDQVRTNQEILDWFQSLTSLNCYATGTPDRFALEQTFATEHPNYMQYFTSLFFFNPDASPRLPQVQYQAPLNHEVTLAPQTQQVSTLTDPEFLHLFKRFQEWPSFLQSQTDNQQNRADVLTQRQ